MGSLQVQHLAVLTALVFLSFFSAVESANSIRHDPEKMALFNSAGLKLMEFGSSTVSSSGFKSVKTSCNADSSKCLHTSKEGHKLSVQDYSGNCKVIAWEVANTTTTSDCVSISDLHWFGGAEQKTQYWPLENFESLSHSVVPVELNDRAVADAIWYNSAGTLYFADKGAPLFYEQNTTKSGYICLVGNLTAPYRNRSELAYEYYVCSLDNAKEAYQYLVNNFISKPSGYPNKDMIGYPIWSTWARYARNINTSVVKEFADQIVSNGFNNSQLEIDDKWETCYGSATFNTTRFPSMKNLSTYLHNLGFHVTLWTHFFIQLDCTETLEYAKNKSYLVKDMNGNVNTTWWNGNATVVDFTNSAAREWWEDQHTALLNETGIDAFKFDAGETSWMPQLPNLTRIAASPYEDYPGNFTAEYVRLCAKFGGRTEFRTAHYTQDLPIFIRMIDKDSVWGFDNGIKTLVTTMLQMNSVGYPLVLPDMIGGNAYDNDTVSKELFIRWVQANTFMPAMQFSIVPWDYDNETVEISLKYANLHAQYKSYIIKAMEKNMEDGTPVNPPVWWLAPTNETALADNSEYLLGEYILVAPILDNATYTRDIFLPNGTWWDPNYNVTYVGPTTISNYSAPLAILPYFIRSDANDTTTTTTTASATTKTSTTASETTEATTTEASSKSIAEKASITMTLILVFVMLR